jgi:hypothetical protein
MPDFQASVCVRIQESEHVRLQVIADWSFFFALLGWHWGLTLFGAFDRFACHVVAVSLSIIVLWVNGVCFTPLALSQARATHESANCASAPHRNRLARNGSSWHLHTSTSAQKRANSADIMMDLHHTIMWHRVIVLKRSLQIMLARSMPSTGMAVRGQGAREQQWIKITS